MNRILARGVSPYDTTARGRVSKRDKEAAPLDDRATKGVLGRWSELIEKGHPFYNELHTALNQLCDRYGKKPNGLCRVSVVSTDPAESGVHTSATNSSAAALSCAARMRFAFCSVNSSVSPTVPVPCASR